MNKFCILLFVVITLLFYSCSTSIKNYNPSKKYPKQQLQQDYTLLKNILQKKHPSLYWYTSRDSMDMYFNQYYNAIEDSMTEQQFGWKIIAPLTQKIHCGHTSFGMSKAYNKWVKNKILPSFPLFVKVWNDTMAITTNINFKDTILKRGTLITGINGKTNAEIIHTCFHFMPQDGYNNNANFQRLSNNFPYYHRNVFGTSKNYLINYLDESGKEKKTTVPLFILKKDSSNKNYTAKKIKENKKEFKKKQLQNFRSLAIDTANNTAIVSLNTFNNGRLRKFFRQTFNYVKKTNIANVVVDIRSNGGGKINFSTLLTKYVINHPFKVADSSYAIAKTLRPYSKYITKAFFNNIGLYFSTKKKKDGMYHFKWWERKKYYPKTKNHFDGNLFVLINGQTFSASALFCNAIKGQPNITLVGEETGGGWYGNNGIMIPDITLPNTHLRVRLPLFKLVQYKHVQKDGHGVLPDVYVPTNYRALIKGYDKKMQVVMEMIMKKATANGQ